MESLGTLTSSEESEIDEGLVKIDTISLKNQEKIHALKDDLIQPNRVEPMEIQEDVSEMRRAGKKEDEFQLNPGGGGHDEKSGDEILRVQKFNANVKKERESITKAAESRRSKGTIAKTQSYETERRL